MPCCVRGALADTNIGVDDRNQFQLIESQPGGLAGLKRVVDELHLRGVRALWPYNPWVRTLVPLKVLGEKRQSAMYLTDLVFFY